MKQRNYIKFTIEKNGENIEVDGYIDDNNNLYRRYRPRTGEYKAPILCSCTGNTKETATPFKADYKNRKIVCPECGKTGIITENHEDREKAAEEENKEKLKNLYIGVAATEWEYGWTFYKLSAKIPYEDWKDIKQYFDYNFYDEEMEIDYGSTKGWTTRSPEKVEKILVEKGLIKPENTMKAMAEKYEKQQEEYEKRQEERNKLVKEIDTAFKDAEKPEGEFDPEGEKLNDPVFKPNIYGGGEWYIINDEYIWKIRNNGADGDDWSLNNIKTQGAGAIGLRVPYTSELAEKIRKYVRGEH